MSVKVTSTNSTPNMASPANVYIEKALEPILLKPELTAKFARFVKDHSADFDANTVGAIESIIKRDNADERSRLSYLVELKQKFNELFLLKSNQNFIELLTKLMKDLDTEIIEQSVVEDRTVIIPTFSKSKSKDDELLAKIAELEIYLPKQKAKRKLTKEEIDQLIQAGAGKRAERKAANIANDQAVRDIDLSQVPVLVAAPISKAEQKDLLAEVHALFSFSDDDFEPIAKVASVFSPDFRGPNELPELGLNLSPFARKFD